MKFRKPGFDFYDERERESLTESISSLWFGYPDAGVTLEAGTKTISLIIGLTWCVEYSTENTEADTFTLSLIAPDATDDALLQFGRHIAARLDLEILEQPTDSLSTALIVKSVSRSRRLEDIEAAVSVVVAEKETAVRDAMDRIRTELEPIYKEIARRTLKVGKVQTKETLKHHGRSIKEFLKPMLKEGMKVVIRKTESDHAILSWDSLLGVISGYFHSQREITSDFLVKLLVKMRDSERVPISVYIMWKGDSIDTREPDSYMELSVTALTTETVVGELNALIVEAEKLTPALQQCKDHWRTINNTKDLTTKVRTALISEFLREEGSGDLLDFAKTALDLALSEPIEVATVKKK